MALSSLHRKEEEADYDNDVVCFLLGDSPASDLYMPTFRNTLSVPPAFEDGTDRVFRNIGIYKSDAGESPKRKQTTF